MEQSTLLEFATNGRRIRADKFLEEMDKAIPWGKFLGLVCPKYYKKKDHRGRKRADLETLLRVYFLQQWFSLSDLSAEEMVHDRLSFRRFVNIDICETSLDETTICKFRHFLEEEQIPEKMFVMVRKILEEKHIIVRDGTCVDATILRASSSTKNKGKKRDEEMSSTKKGNNWHFGMKLHIGTDAKSKVIHSVKTTTAKVHDSEVFEELLHGKEQSVFGDKAYANKEKKRKWRAEGKYWGVQEKAGRGKKLSLSQQKKNKKRSSVRAGVEHPFHIMKNLWNYRKVRYKGLMKNTAQMFSLCFLSNLYQVRHIFVT